MGRVLIVDDDTDTCRVAAKLLRRHGKAVTCATRAADALAVLHSEPIDLIILDLLMPVMDGVELLRAVRRQAQWDRVAVVAYSAVADSDASEEMRQLGAQACIIKGEGSFNTLCSLVEEFHNGRWPASPKADAPPVTGPPNGIERRRSLREPASGEITIRAGQKTLRGSLHDASKTSSGGCRTFG